MRGRGRLGGARTKVSDCVGVYAEEREGGQQGWLL